MWVSMTIKSRYNSRPTSVELMTRQSLQRAAEEAKQRGNNYSLSILIGKNKWQGSGKEVEMESNCYIWCDEVGAFSSGGTSRFSRAALFLLHWEHSKRVKSATSANRCFDRNPNWSLIKSPYALKRLYSARLQWLQVGGTIKPNSSKSLM